ncbi:uncharacterized protein LOC133928297 [Phragmites australis]|uniref:uncharacterized protein LOC133928297 n=1 Tax=Phragmites australis TaxID=29695 RepID=UPI002D770DD8|nr:uncharacterized protein LOC133928297 [Phragmites australis]
MGSRYEVEVTVGSARDLKNVNCRNGDLKPYAVLWVDSGAKCSTRVDLDNGDNPVWDDKLLVPLPPSVTRLEDAVLYIDVVHANAAEGVKPLVGSARLPLRDVLNRPSGRPHGRLDVREAARYYDPSPFPAPYGNPAGGSRDPYYAAPPPYAPVSAGYGQPEYAAPPAGYLLSPPETEATMRRTGALLAITSASALVPFTTVVGSMHVMLMLALFVTLLLGCAMVLLSPAYRDVAVVAVRSLEILAARARAATGLRWAGLAVIMFYAAGNLRAEAAKGASVDKVNGFILFLVFLAGVWTVNLSMLTRRGSRPPAGPVAAAER